MRLDVEQRPERESPSAERPPARDAQPDAPPAEPGHGGVLRRLGIPVGATLIMTVLTLAASGVNYASNLVFSRVLEPAQFGDLTALLALTVIAAVPSGAAQTVVADRLAAHAAAGDRTKMAYLIRHAVAHVGVWVVGLGLLVLATSPFLADLLNLQSATTLVAMTPMLLLSFFTPLAFGILQGVERYVALGLVMLWIAVSRIAFGVPWALSDFGGGPGGALLGMAVGNAVALLAAAYVVRELMLRRGTGAATAGVRRRPDTTTLVVGGAFVGFALLSNVDVLLAKLLLDPKESGEYAALATVGKIILFLPGAIALVMVPRAARARVEHGNADGILRFAVVVVAAATMVLAIPAALEPDFVVRTMFGEEYLGVSGGVLPIALAGAGLALIYLLVVWTAAISDRRWTVLLVGGMVLQVIMILLMHDSATDVAVAQAITVGSILVANELFFHPLLRGGKAKTKAHRAA